MSVEIKYKGNTIASASTDTTKTIKTSGKYCEADIEVINTQDVGGGLPYSQITEITLVEELNSYNILQAMGVKCKYRNSQIFMFIYSDVAAVGGGNYTNNNYLLRHRGTTVIGGWLDQTPSKIPPSNMVLKGGANYSTDGASKVEADGSFTFRRSNATVFAPVGAKCIVLEQAWTDENGVFDVSLWGE